jgi:hypothetical protein
MRPISLAIVGLLLVACHHRAPEPVATAICPGAGPVVTHARSVVAATVGDSGWISRAREHGVEAAATVAVLVADSTRCLQLAHRQLNTPDDIRQFVAFSYDSLFVLFVSWPSLEGVELVSSRGESYGGGILHVWSGRR